MRVLVVWCPDWPTTAAGYGEHVAVCVVERQRIVATSLAARQSGIRLGMRKRQAESCCPGVVMLAPDPHGQARVFEPVVGALTDLCPGLEVLRPGLCALAVRGPARYFGGERSLVEKI